MSFKIGMNVKPALHPSPSPEPRFRTDTEKEILRVLWANRGEYLVRSQVHSRMTLPPKDRPTTSRIGQVLKSLYEHDFLDRTIDRYQGRRRSAFYRLNKKGFDACLKHCQLDQHESERFPVTEEILEKYLTTKSFLGKTEAPIRRIIGFYSYHGGLGQTSMVAHTANGLALQNERKDILVMDLDLSAPDLDRFFPSEERGDSERGLRGLLSDFHSQPERTREKWLETSILQDRFVIRPRLEQAPNLYFLRSGLRAETPNPSLSERATILELLQLELSTAADARLPPDRRFLPKLRKYLTQRFDLVLVDSQAGQNSSVLALSRLSDQWVVSIRPSEDAETFRALRGVLAGHLWSMEEHGQISSGILIALHLSEYGTGPFDGLGWVRDKLLNTNENPEPLRRNLWTHRHNKVLQRDPTHWKLTKIYAPLAQRLSGVMPDDYLPPEAQAIITLLDPKTPRDYRTLTKDIILERWSLGTLARSLEGLSEEKPALERLDPIGVEELQEILTTFFHRTVEKLSRDS